MPRERQYLFPPVMLANGPLHHQATEPHFKRRKSIRPTPFQEQLTAPILPQSVMILPGPSNFVFLLHTARSFVVRQKDDTDRGMSSCRGQSPPFLVTSLNAHDDLPGKAEFKHLLWLAGLMTRQRLDKLLRFRLQRPWVDRNVYRNASIGVAYGAERLPASQPKQRLLERCDHSSAIDWVAVPCLGVHRSMVRGTSKLQPRDRTPGECMIG